ncbi:hypothetical protein [Alkalilacustris brevis]|nr:hypothetical protein [Alkalilacustris brevis]
MHDVSDTPVATYTAFWMGFSPVRDISTEVSERFVTTGPRVPSSQ